MHLVGEIVPRIRAEIFRVLSIDESVKHQRIQGKQWSSLDDVLIRSAVPIRNPPLTSTADARKIVVFLAPPDGIGVAKPERRWVRSRCEIHVQVGLVRAEL